MSDLDREKWDDRYANASAAPQIPSTHLTKLDTLLPRAGSALDIAGGAGRHALWLAARGLDVTLVDISPRGLEIARDRAAMLDLKLNTVCRDLQREPLPAGHFDVIASFHYLQRELWPAMRSALAPGGWLVFVQPTQRNLQRHKRPPADYLLHEGEAREVATGLQIIEYQEDWLDEGRHEAVVIARRTV